MKYQVPGYLASLFEQGYEHISIGFHMSAILGYNEFSEWGIQ